jgi:hypothetical protein
VMLTQVSPLTHQSLTNVSLKEKTFVRMFDTSG